MVHEIYLIEGYSKDFDDFEKDFNDKMYANGKARLRFREARIYTFAINEVGVDEFRGDMKSLMGRIWPDRDDGSFQWHKMIGWANKRNDIKEQLNRIEELLAKRG
jgi:hypothetical protein